MKYHKVRNVHTASETVITEEVYDAYQAEFVMLVENCDPKTGKKPVKKTKKADK